jgi:hypothetical protein
VSGKPHPPNVSGDFKLQCQPNGANGLAVASRLARGSIAKSVSPVEIVRAEEAHTVFYPHKKRFLFYTPIQAVNV